MLDDLFSAKILIIGFIASWIYFIIFHTQKYKEINEMMYDNARRTSGGLANAGKALGKGAVTGYRIYKLFRR